MSSKKGGSFERSMCKLFSLWWSEGRTDELFWRTAGSGGRATQRRKKKQTTAGHYGDVCATDKEGEALTRFVTIELKRGYNRVSPFDLVDRPAKCAQQTFEEWIQKAQSDKEASGSIGWLIVHKRDKREPVVYLSHAAYGLLSRLSGCDLGQDDGIPFVMFECFPRRYVDGKFASQKFEEIYATPLDVFIKYVKRDYVEEIVHTHFKKETA